MSYCVRLHPEEQHVVLAGTQVGGIVPAGRLWAAGSSCGWQAFKQAVGSWKQC